MKDKVILGKDGELAIAVPLFRLTDSEELALPGYSLMIAQPKPLMYLIDMGKDTCLPVRSELVEKHATILSDL